MQTWFWRRGSLCLLCLLPSFCQPAVHLFRLTWLTIFLWSESLRPQLCPCVYSSSHLFYADIFLPTLSHHAHASIHFLLSCSIFVWSLYCLFLTSSCLRVGRLFTGAAAFTMSGLCRNQLSRALCSTDLSLWNSVVAQFLIMYMTISILILTSPQKASIHSSKIISSSLFSFLLSPGRVAHPTCTVRDLRPLTVAAFWMEWGTSLWQRCVYNSHCYHHGMFDLPIMH